MPLVVLPLMLVDATLLAPLNFCDICVHASIGTFVYVSENEVFEPPPVLTGATVIVPFQRLVIVALPADLSPVIAIVLGTPPNLINAPVISDDELN